jgi:hypothetical protein
MADTTGPVILLALECMSAAEAFPGTDVAAATTMLLVIAKANGDWRSNEPA